MSYAILTTPIGNLCITCSPTGVTSIERMELGEPVLAKPKTLAAKAEAQLMEYFAGQRTSFDLPLEPEGTAFQMAVWKELRRIPCGKTRSYASVAKKVACDSPRAIGTACGANKLLIVIPCHRVISKDGGLGGFSAGLENKEWLLEFEKSTGK